MIARVTALLSLAGLAGLLAACGPTIRDPDNLISPAAQSGQYPEIVPVSPLVAATDDLLPDEAAAQGQSLQARAADLRRRAELLRQMEF